MGTVLCLHRSDASPYPLYASMNTIGLWRSTDDGASWDLITTPLDCGSLCSVVTQSGNPNRVLVLEGVG
jgi:hypothetical protein